MNRPYWLRQLHMISPPPLSVHSQPDPESLGVMHIHLHFRARDSLRYAVDRIRFVATVACCMTMSHMLMNV